MWVPLGIDATDGAVPVETPGHRRLGGSYHLAAMDRPLIKPFVAEKLRSYVYLLRDPRNGEIFYVGKGVGNRVNAHVSDALVSATVTDKLDRIREIHADGLEVDHELLRFGMNESEAFEVESAAIQLLGLEELTNAVSGHHVGARGRMSLDVAISMFDAPQLAVGDIVEPLILIKVPKTWYPSIPAEELFEATRGWWTFGERREGAKYAMAVSRSVIREVYRIDRWRPRAEGDRDWQDDVGKRPRWGFEGSVAHDLAHYRNRSVKQYFPNPRDHFKYVNC